jgi:hypothetical protein
MLGRDVNDVKCVSNVNIVNYVLVLSDSIDMHCMLSFGA